MATLNTEPARPEEREEQHLPPKSYKDAAVEEEEAPSSANGVNRHSGVVKESAANGAKTRVKGEAVGHTASVLRIVGTGAESKGLEQGEKNPGDEKGEGKDKENGRPQYDRQSSKNEYSATGTDDAPRTPPRKKHRKSLSQTTRSTHENLTTEEKVLGLKHQDADSKPNQTNQNTTVFEKVSVQNNGSKLISIKPSPNYEKQLENDRKELASGRTPGQRWGESAIRFAPMNVPLQRRLQTLVVLFHVLCIALFVSAFFFLCAIPLFWPLLIPYMIYCMASKASTSGTLSHRSDFLRSLPVWSLFASYFPARLHRTQELPPTRKYIFGYHPHGIISMGAFAAFGTEALGFSQLFPGIKNTLLTLDSNFRIPIYRDYALAMGLASVSKESCENLLSKGGPNKEGMGRAITIVIGGARESLDAHPYSLRLVLARRKGFVKMALRTGADLVPVLAFGENDLYDQFGVETHPKIHKIQLLVKKLLGFTIPLFHARGVFNYDVGLMPYRRPINVVVGRPVRVEQMKSPDQESIDRVHGEYVRELERLWDLWKDEFAKRREGELEILE